MNPLVQYLGECRSMPSRRIDCKITGQLPEQKRIATRLTGDQPQLFAANRCIYVERKCEERSRLVVGHGLEREAGARLRAWGLEQRPQERLGRDFFGTKAR